MTAIDDTVFSEYEVREMNAIFDDGEVGTIKCVGSLEEESTVRTVTKNCRGVPVKTRTRGTGSGTLTLTMHVPYELYAKMMGMNSDKLIEGVYGYGRDTVHPVFTLTADVFDEDDNEKYKAWPNCTMSSGPARSVENGSEEVAEVEAEISFNPDDNGFGLYEARVEDLKDTEAKTNWMNAFTPDLVKLEEV